MDQQERAQTTQEDLPPSLQCALQKPGDYAVRLRTGEVVRFTHAERHASFVTLFAPDSSDFPHGLDVRITEITWSARGPGRVLAPESPEIGMPESPNTAHSSPGVRVPLRIARADS